MIRRNAGSDYLLIRQHDHAVLAGLLARHLGNAQFALPAPFAPVIDAVILHDAGWFLHDQKPTLNPHGKPVHVFESHAPIALPCWTESVRIATSSGPYEALLVSLHVLNLSAFALSQHKQPTRQELFEFNKFMHAQIEIQDQLRKELKMDHEIGRHLGLVPMGQNDTEDLLRFNFRYLTFMDRISLSLCCGQNIFPHIDDVHPMPAQGCRRIVAAMPDTQTISVTPWPFNVASIEATVAARRVARTTFADVETFQKQYEDAPIEAVDFRVVSGY